MVTAVAAHEATDEAGFHLLVCIPTLAVHLSSKCKRQHRLDPVGHDTVTVLVMVTVTV